MSDETRITDPSTGGQKGSKASQFFDAPAQALLLLGEVYGHGAEKYDHHNYRKGYKWSLSYNALFRHVFASMAGEDIDPESGLPHMAHAAWHCLTLTQFLRDKQSGAHPASLDDRFRPIAPSKPPTTTVDNAREAHADAYFRDIPQAQEPEPDPDTVLVIDFAVDGYGGSHVQAHEQGVPHYHYSSKSHTMADEAVCFPPAYTLPWKHFEGWRYVPIAEWQPLITALVVDNPDDHVIAHVDDVRHYHLETGDQPEIGVHPYTLKGLDDKVSLPLDYCMSFDRWLEWEEED